MLGVCKSELIIPFRNSFCADYDVAWEVLHETATCNVGSDFEIACSGYNRMITNNVYSKQLPMSMTVIQNAVSALRRTIKYSILKQDIKDRLDYEIELWMNERELAIESTQFFLGGIGATADMILFHSNATIRDFNSIESSAIQEHSRKGSFQAPSKYGFSFTFLSLTMIVISWAARHGLLYLWGGMDPFLPIPYEPTAEARSISRFRRFIARVTPDVDLDIERAEECRERYAILINRAVRIQDGILQDTMDMEKDQITKGGNPWDQILNILGQGGNDIAELNRDMDILSSIIPVFGGAEQFYRFSKNDLTHIKSPYMTLDSRLDQEGFIQHMQKGEYSLAVLFGHGTKGSSPETTIEVRDIVKGIERGARALQENKDNWDKSQAVYSKALFEPRSESKFGGKSINWDNKRAIGYGQTKVMSDN